VNRRSGAAGFVALGALVQPATWLVVRSDLAGPRWTDGHALETWVLLEAVAAMAVFGGAVFGGAVFAAVAVGVALAADRLTRRG